MLDLTKLDKAIQDIFEGNTDKAGEPYFGHIKRVVEMVKVRTNHPHTIIAAYCHDLMEDTSIDMKELLKKTLPSEMDVGITSGLATAMVMVLTKSKLESYDAYISRVLKGLTYAEPHAHPGTLVPLLMEDLVLIKKCDLLDNADPERLAKIPDQEMADALRAKYYNAMYQILGT